MKKRFLSTLLAIVMLLSLLPTTVFAVDTPTEKWEDAADTAWYNSNGSEFTITTAAQLAGLAKLVNEGTTFSRETVKLGADIDLAGKAWTPIGTDGDQNGFQGVFDGQNKVISNLTIDQSKAKYQSAGLFGSVMYGTIQNVTLQNVNIISYTTGNSAGATSCGTAAVVGSAQSSTTISGVKVLNANITSNRYVGGIVGYGQGVVENCSVENVTLKASPDNYFDSKYDNGDKVGGIAGFSNTKLDITNCVVKGTNSLTAYRDVGGVVGYTTESSTVSRNTVQGSLTIVVDQKTQPTYEGDMAANAGAIVGRNTPQGEGNTVDENAEIIFGAYTAKNFEDVISKAEAGNTVKLLSDVTVASNDSNAAANQNPALKITKAITLDGNGHIIKAGTFKMFKNNNNEEKPGNSILDVQYVSEGTVTIKNLTIEGNSTSKHCLNVVKSNGVVLEDVTLKNTAGWGLTVNASSVTATGKLELDNNGWGDVINVGWGSGITADGCTFNAASATLVGVDGVYADSDDVNHANDVDKFNITLPEDFTCVYSGENGIYWAPAVAQIKETGTKYATLAAAIAAAEGQTVTLLNNVAEDITIPADKTLTLDLNGKTLTNVSSDTITVALNGTLIINGSGTVDNKTHQRAAIVNNGTVTLNGGAYTRSAEASTSTSTPNGNSYYNILNHGNMTINSGVSVTSSGHFSSLIDNGYFNYTSTDPRKGYVSGTNQANPSLTINGGTFSGGINTIKNDDNATLIINDGSFSNVTQATVQNNNVATINGGTFNAEGYDVLENIHYSGNYNRGSLTVTGGAFTGALYTTTDATWAITGGLFSSDPSAYCGENLTGVANTDSATKAQYPFTVGAKVVNVETSISAGEPVGSVDFTDTKVTDTTVKNAAKDTATQTSLQEAATIAGLSNNSAVVGTEDAAKAALNEVDGITVADSDTVTVVVQPYLDVNVKEATSDGDKTMTVEIEAKYNVVATTDPENINLTGEGGAKNAVALKTGETMTVTHPVTIKLPLPANFVDSTSSDVYIRHVKANGTVYVYKADVTYDDGSGTYYATFVNPNGFSTFILTTSTAASITVDETTTYYDTLAEAVSAVQNGQTIKLEKDNSETITVSRDITFIVDTNSKSFNTENITAGSYTTVEKTTVDSTKTRFVFDYTAPSGGGGGGGGSTTYSVTAPTSTKNGSVTVSPKSASKGKTVTITVKPDAGYELDKLTVTDKNGDTVTLTKKSDTQYTFTMPASKVEITAVFAEIPQTDPCDDFDDLDPNAWYHDAVNYVLTKGMMSGVSDDEFAPNATLTRAMVVQILWAVEGKPQVNYAMNYGDVSQSDWYAEAVRWAASQGIASGVADGSFAPGASITREQLMTMLYAYAQKKGEGFTGSWMFQLDFADQSQVSSWAYEPACWCTMNGVVSGKDGGRLDPVGTATRAEAAQMLMKFCQTLGE